MSFFGDSAPHQLQTNGLNLIPLFSPMALKFGTSSNYKKTISPPKIFQTLRLLVSPPLEQKSKFFLSRSHRLKLSLFTTQPLGSPVPTMLAFFSSENPCWYSHQISKFFSLPPNLAVRRTPALILHDHGYNWKPPRLTRPPPAVLAGLTFSSL